MTVELAAQSNSWSNLALRCNGRTLTHLWKLTHKQRKTADGISHSYLKSGILAHSFSCKELSDQKPTANTMRNTRRTTLCWMQSKYLSTSVHLFSKTLNITSTEISYQFLAPKGPFFRRNKVTNSSSSTDPFSAAAKTLVLGNLFKHVWFAITFARVVRLPLGIMTRMRRLSNFLPLYPQVANFPCECDVKSKNLE